MMFLFFQLVFWLLVAGVLGFAAGWFLQAGKTAKKIAEHRERYRQHIQRLEQGLAEVAEDEPYAKERRDPIGASPNPESFLSGAEEAAARLRNESKGSKKSVPPARAESSGSPSAQTITLASLATEPAAASETIVTNENGFDEASVAETARHFADDSKASLATAPAGWDGRLLSCESDITVLQRRLDSLEQQVQAKDDAGKIKPLEKAVAAMSAANNTATPPAAEIQPYGMKEPDGLPDDLKRIWGVGPKLESALNDMGIFHFRQIAAFSDEDIETVSSKLENFSDRVKTDDWVSQAKKLMAEVK